MTKALWRLAVWLCLRCLLILEKLFWRIIGHPFSGFYATIGKAKLFSSDRETVRLGALEGLYSDSRDRKQFVFRLYCSGAYDDSTTSFIKQAIARQLVEEEFGSGSNYFDSRALLAVPKRHINRAVLFYLFVAILCGSLLLVLMVLTVLNSSLEGSLQTSISLRGIFAGGLLVSVWKAIRVYQRASLELLHLGIALQRYTDAREAASHARDEAEATACRERASLRLITDIKHIIERFDSSRMWSVICSWKSRRKDSGAG